MRIRLSHLLLDAAGESAAAVGEGEGGEVGEGDGDAEGECGQRGEGQHRVEAQDEQEDGDLRVLPPLSHSLFFWQCFHCTMVGARKWLGRMHRVWFRSLEPSLWLFPLAHINLCSNS